MANRRMFSKSITNSSNFLMMPLSSQGLYFHLGMNADDDGFCEHFAIMRMVEAKPDDLKILQAKGFIQIFDERVLVIVDWKENNYLRPDRYTESKYIEIYKEELKRLTSGIPVVDTGKVRLGKDRIGEERLDKPLSALADVSTKEENGFLLFWENYPKKELKKKTKEIWDRKKLNTRLQEILVFIDSAKNTDRWKKGYVKQPPAFLNGECWNDDISGYNDKTSKKPDNTLQVKQGKYDNFE